MSFNAYTMAYITKRYHHSGLSTWQKLQHHIEHAAYNGYDFYELEPREWQYRDKLREYGFEVVYNDVLHQDIVRWDNV